jgi:hypothetical protein
MRKCAVASGNSWLRAVAGKRSRFLDFLEMIRINAA